MVPTCKHCGSEVPIDEAIVVRLIQGDRYVYEEIPYGFKAYYAAKLMEHGWKYKQIEKALRVNSVVMREAKEMVSNG